MNKPPRSIGLLTHPKKPDALSLAERMADYLRDRDCEVWVGNAWDEPEALAHVEQLDLLVTLGGDGTMLRAARVASRDEIPPCARATPADAEQGAPPEAAGEGPGNGALIYGVPILGVKLGRVSFLAEVLPDEWQAPLEAVLEGNYWLEERMLLDVAVARNGEVSPATWPSHHCYRALNDVVIARGGLARLITIEASVDHRYLTRYRADGVIVSTPTGCTGYALAAGGPILPPELKNILLIPICAHLSLDRPIVLSQGAAVRLEIHADYPAILTVDGQFEITLVEGDRVEVHASQHVSQFVHTQDRAYFYRTLMDRLRWTG